MTGPGPIEGPLIPMFSRDSFPGPVEHWGRFRKKVVTRAIRCPFPFNVATSEGTLHCRGGWLAMDARGYPYPIAESEFDLIYEQAPDEDEDGRVRAPAYLDRRDGRVRLYGAGYPVASDPLAILSAREVDELVIDWLRGPQGPQGPAGPQ